MAISYRLYQKVFQEIDSALRGSYNIMIVSIPGMGLAHLLKEYSLSHSQVKYLDKITSDVFQYSILDLASDLNPDFSSQVDSYFHRMGPGQVAVVALNTPSLLDSNEYKHSFWGAHIYKKIWMEPFGIEDLKALTYKFGQKYSSSEIDKIMSVTGGLPQLVKLETSGSRDNLDRVIRPIIKVIHQTSAIYLEKLGITRDHVLVSQLLRDYQPDPSQINIQLFPDLSFSENGQVGKYKLTRVEAEIINYVLDHSTIITKEQISDIKWGGGKYDKFSDQAIKQQIMRLNHKLAKYQFVAIPKVGYTLSHGRS